MSDTAVSSTPTGETTLPQQTESSTTGPSETTTTSIPEETTTSIPEQTTTSIPEPTTETTSTPESTSTTEEPSSTTTTTTEEPSSTTEEPSSTTEQPTSTEESTTEPESSTTPNVTVVTVTPTTLDDTTVTITTTSVNTDQSSTGFPSSSTLTSSSSTSSSSMSATPLPSGGGGGLSQPAKIAIAIIIPIFAVILIAFLGIFFWRRYKKRKDSEEMRRKEVEEYGYNPNKDASPGPAAVLGAAAGANQGGDMAEMEAGYRGWGSTAGGRKASAPLSASATTNATVVGYGNTPYSGASANGGQQYPAPHPPPQQPELYGSPPMAATALPVAAGAAVLGAAALSEEEAKQNRDRHSHSPLLSSPTNRPSTADSSTIGAPATATGPSELDDGLHRGDSVASSRYTNATHQSEDSGAHEAPGNNGYRNTYVSDGNDYYNDVANPYAGDYDYQDHSPEQGYHQPPMIQQVGARRNTRIETPPDTHYAQMPRQGTSGIAQNF